MFNVGGQFHFFVIVINSHRQAPTTKRSQVEMSNGKRRVQRKEGELAHKSVPSLRGGGWGNNLLYVPGVHFNEERNKEHKTGLFIQNTNIMHNGFCLGCTEI